MCSILCAFAFAPLKLSNTYWLKGTPFGLSVPHAIFLKQSSLPSFRMFGSFATSIACVTATTYRFVCACTFQAEIANLCVVKAAMEKAVEEAEANAAENIAKLESENTDLRGMRVSSRMHSCNL